MAEAWYYQRGDQRVGPVSSHELKQLAHTGELQPSDLLWKDGMQHPVAASHAKGLFPETMKPEGTVPPPTARPTAPPLPADDARPSPQRIPAMQSVPCQQSPVSTTAGPLNRTQLAQKIQQLRREIAQLVLGGEPCLPSSPLIDAIRAQHAQLQDQISKGHDRVQQLTAAKDQYVPLEKAYAQKRKELAGAESQLESLARPLGHAAFQAYSTGEVGNQPCFADRIALRERIEALQKEQEQLALPSDASFLQKTKAKAQQLVVAGKIKIKELKIGGQETQIGKSLLDSGTEQTIAGATTADLLEQVCQQRAAITKLRSEAEAARAAVDSKRHEFCGALEFSHIENVETFDAEIRECKTRISQSQKEVTALENGIPDRLAADPGQVSTPLAGLLGELRQANEQMTSLGEKGGSRSAIDAAGHAALDKTRQLARTAVDTAKSPQSRDVIARAGTTGLILSRRHKVALGAIGLGIIVAAIITYGLSGESGGTLTPSAKVLPAEYRTLAENVAMDIKQSRDQFRDNKGTAEHIAEVHAAVMALRGIKSADRDITYIAEQAQDAYSDAIKHLEQRNSLPKPPSAVESFVSGLINGYFGNFLGGYAEIKDAEGKQTAIMTEVQAIIAAFDKADAAQQLLPKVAEKHSATFCDSTERITVVFQESWGSFGPYDWCLFLNRGEVLRDCTLVVQLTGASGEVRNNVHFLKDWPTNEWMYARYAPGEEILGRKVGRMTVNKVKQLDVTIYSPQFATLIKYVYEGPEKDKHIAALCKDLKFTERFQPFVGGMIWDTKRGVYITLDGVEFIPKCRVDVTFRQGSQSKGLFWDVDDYWKKGEEKWFGTSKDELTFDPDNIDLAVSFPGTNYQYHATYQRSSNGM